MTGFFAMGGYAVYVWTAWGAGLAVLVGLAVASWARARRLAERVAMLEAQMPRRRPRAAIDGAAGQEAEA